MALPDRNAPVTQGQLADLEAKMDLILLAQTEILFHLRPWDKDPNQFPLYQPEALEAAAVLKKDELNEVLKLAFAELERRHQKRQAQ